MGNPLTIKPSFPLKLGWIPYWNLSPLRIEIEKQAKGEISFQSGAPALVNKMLKEGQVSLAPCSSICLLSQEDYEVALPLGVAANGKVSSVYLGFSRGFQGAAEISEFIKERTQQIREIYRSLAKKHAGDKRLLAKALVAQCRKSQCPGQKFNAQMPIPKLKLTPASATSSGLARLLFELWFSERPVEVNGASSSNAQAESGGDLDLGFGPSPLELLIGDEALFLKPSFAHVVDLGEVWKTITGMPFVFAVWQKRAWSLSPYWSDLLMTAAEHAQARMQVEPSYYLDDLEPKDAGGHRIDLTRYWKNIFYQLNPDHFKSLHLFLSLMRDISKQQIDDQTITRLHRIESFGLRV